MTFFLQYGPSKLQALKNPQIKKKMTFNNSAKIALITKTALNFYISRELLNKRK